MIKYLNLLKNNNKRKSGFRVLIINKALGNKETIT